MANKLIKGTLVLSIATLFTKIIGSLFWAPFQNIAGDQIVGLYRISFPFYQILLTIASAGIPITISKFVSERLSSNDWLGARRVLHAGSLILSITGLLCAILLYFGAGFISDVLLNNPPTKSALKVLAFAVLIVPIMGALRGYFQGHQEMMPTGISQVVEQIIRVSSVILLTYMMINVGSSNPLFFFCEQSCSPEYVAAGATAGAFLGAIGGLIVVLWYNYRDRQQKKHAFPKQSTSKTESIPSLSRKILTYAIPISLASLVLPLIGLMDSFTVPRLLMWNGHSEAMTNELFGVYSRGEPFVNVIMTFSSSLTLALIPAIASHVAKSETETVNRKISQIWMMTLVVSLPSSLGLAILAEPFNIAMYKDAQGTLTLSVLAFSAIFSTLSLTSSGILQGLGFNHIPVRHLLIGAAVKVSGNFLFIPYIGITGSALAMVCAYFIVCFLNMWMVMRKTQVTISFKNILWKPFFCAVIMAASIFVLYLGFQSWWITEETSRLTYIFFSLFLCFIGMIIYVITLLMTKTIHQDDIQMLPKGNTLISILTKLRLIRPESNTLS